MRRCISRMQGSPLDTRPRDRSCAHCPAPVIDARSLRHFGPKLQEPDTDPTAAALRFFPVAQRRHTATPARTLPREAPPRPTRPESRSSAQLRARAHAQPGTRPQPRSSWPASGPPPERRGPADTSAGGLIYHQVSQASHQHRRAPGVQGPDLRKRLQTGPRGRQKTGWPTCVRWDHGETSPTHRCAGQDPDRGWTNPLPHQTNSPAAAGQRHVQSCTPSRRRTCWALCGCG